MGLQAFIDWLVSFTFNQFQPQIKFAKKCSWAIEPTRRKDGSLGYDLYTPISLEFKPGEQIVVDTGIIFELPSYVGMFIWGKSSVTLRQIYVCSGAVDPGYTGSVGVILQNDSSKTVTIDERKPIARVTFQLAIRPIIIEIDKKDVSETARGERGFGGNKEWYIPEREVQPNDH